MATQEDLLHALDLAHNAGDRAAAQDIAMMIHNGEYDPSPVPKILPPGGGNTSGSPQKTFEGHASNLSSGKDTLQFGPFDTHIPLPASTADQLSGIGSAFHDVGQGIGQKLGLTSSQDVHDTRATDKELMQDPNGRMGNIAGNAAIMAPAAMIPGMQGIAGATLGGAALGAMQPSESLGEQAANTGIAAAAGPLAHVLPAAGQAITKIPGVKPVMNFVGDMLPGGQQRAASRLATQFAGGPQQADAARLAIEQAGKSGALAGKYGINPTTAQVANNPGLAQMDRTLRNNGRFTTAFGDNDDANRNAIDNILTGISGTPADRLRAGAARDYQARTMYDDALNNPEHFVQPPKPSDASFGEAMDTAQGGTRTPGDNAPAAPMAGDTVTGLSDIGTRLQTLLQRPAMQDAMMNASRIAANFGKPLDDRNLIQQMHYAKMHLDDQIGASMAAGKTNDYRALLDTKHELLGVMDDLSPAYAQARANFQSASRPVNRMELGEALRQKYSPGLGDQGSVSRNPATFVNALRNGDQTAASATGFGGATLENTLHPQDIDALNAAASQLGRQSYAQNAGKAIGSNTGQNLGNAKDMNSIGNLEQALTPEGARGAVVYAALHHPALLPLGVLGSFQRNGAQGLLGKAALNPREMSALLAPKESLMSKYLPSGITSSPVVGGTASSQLQAPTDDGYADGGQPKYEKSSTWDLLKQGWKELTGDSSQPAPNPPQEPGTQASGTVGSDFDRRVQQSVDAQS
jgi:hypothetical protein